MQMTHQGGFVPFESSDGKEVYYQKFNGDSDVWKVPVAGGEETRVLGPAGGFQFAVVAGGIYFNEPLGNAEGIKGRTSLKFFSFAKGIAEKVFDISVSPDGRYVLFSQWDPFVSDLMLVENFADGYWCV